jgi:DNA topoisomerase-1
VRDETKYHRMIPFARALPRIRARVERDLRKPGLPREEEYARANHSYGLTTLHDDHVDVRGSRLRFEFRGKSGKRATASPPRT